MKKLTSFIISLALILLFTDPAYTANADGNTTIQSFSKAKKILLRQVYRDHKTTFYCDCPFNSKKKILPSDNYTPKKEGKRAHRLEWEHIVPAHAFGQSFPEWRTGHPECKTRKGEIIQGKELCQESRHPIQVHGIRYV